MDRRLELLKTVCLRSEDVCVFFITCVRFRSRGVWEERCLQTVATAWGRQGPLWRSCELKEAEEESADIYVRRGAKVVPALECSVRGIVAE